MWPPSEHQNPPMWTSGQTRSVLQWVQCRRGNVFGEGNGARPRRDLWPSSYCSVCFKLLQQPAGGGSGFTGSPQTHFYIHSQEKEGKNTIFILGEKITTVRRSRVIQEELLHFLGELSLKPEQTFCPLKVLTVQSESEAGRALEEGGASRSSKNLRYEMQDELMREPLKLRSQHRSSDERGRGVMWLCRPPKSLRKKNGKKSMFVEMFRPRSNC